MRGKVEITGINTSELKVMPQDAERTSRMFDLLLGDDLQGRKDFISKLEIAEKECYETEYWLELLFETDCMNDKEYKTLKNECGTIRRLLIASLKTVKS